MNRWIVAVALFTLGTTVGIFLYQLDVRSNCRAYAHFVAVEATESPAMEHQNADRLAVGCITGDAAALAWIRFAPRKRRELPL